jgi:tetratricopeptide (TPR) repeat protein
MRPTTELLVTRAIVLPAELLKPPEEPAPERPGESTNPTAAALAEAEAEAAALKETDAPREYLPPLPPPLPPPPPPRRTQTQVPGTGQSPAALRAAQALEKARELSQLLKAEVNTRWFYVVAGSWLVLVLLICGSIFVRSRLAARPTVVDDATLAQDTEERKKELDEGKKLFNAGRYEESLATFRRVLARSPNNVRARQYAQMSENALQGRVEEARKSSEADRLIDLGRAAFAEGKFGEARKKAEEALALDGGKGEAQRLKEDASAKQAELEAAAATEARKKKAAKEAIAKKSAPASEPATVRRPAPAQSTAAPASTSARASTATLNLTFDSPISEGTVMVAVNDQIRLKLPFSFKRKVSIFKTVKETGTVTGTMAVDPGSVAIKVWLSGPDIPTAYKNLTAAVSAGDTHTLRLDYAGGQLNVRLQ